MAYRRRATIVAAFVAVLWAAFAQGGAGVAGIQRRVEIPKTWDDEAMRSFEIPLADPTRSPKYVSARRSRCGSVSWKSIIWPRMHP